MATPIIHDANKGSVVESLAILLAETNKERHLFRNDKKIMQAFADGVVQIHRDAAIFGWKRKKIMKALKNHIEEYSK